MNATREFAAAAGSVAINTSLLPTMPVFHESIVSYCFTVAEKSNSLDTCYIALLTGVRPVTSSALRSL